jgi:hypothetical protein
VTLSSITAAITCNPAPTAKANKPSFRAPLSSAIATVTAAGTAIMSSVAAVAASVW